MIYLLVDSSADIDTDKKEGYLHVPITITIGGKDYQSGIDLDSPTFYSLLTESKEFPKTAQPSPDAFATVFEQVKREGNQLIYFALSSALSGTYQSAQIAKDMVGYEEIYIIDTASLSYGIQLLTGAAENMRHSGHSAKEITHFCEGLKSKIRIVAGVDTLEYLYKGGRLSRASAAMGTMTNIKPVLTVTNEGVAQVIGKSLGKVRAMQAILKFLQDNPADTIYPFYTIYTLGE